MNRWIATTALALALAMGASAAEAKNTLRWSSQGDALTADPHAQNEGPTNAASLNIYDATFARQQVDIFEQDLARSRRISLEEWQSRPWAEKAWEHVAALFGPQL